MEISSANQQVLSTMVLDQTMNRSGATMSKLLEGMQEMNQEIQQVQSNAASAGSPAAYVDIRV